MNEKERVNAVTAAITGDGDVPIGSLTYRIDESTQFAVIVVKVGPGLWEPVSDISKEGEEALRAVGVDVSVWRGFGTLNIKCKKSS